MTFKLSKKYNGKRFRFEAWRSGGASARAEARQLRKKGFLVRVHKKDGVYGIYKRSKS